MIAATQTQTPFHTVKQLTSIMQLYLNTSFVGFEDILK